MYYYYQHPVYVGDNVVYVVDNWYRKHVLLNSFLKNKNE